MYNLVCIINSYLGEICMKNEFKGAILIVIAAFFWGIAATIAKFILNTNADPFKLVNMRLNIAFILLFLILLIFDRQKLKITKLDARYLAVLGVVGIVGVQTTYYFTVSKLNVSMAIFLQYLAPAMIVIYSLAFLKERLSITIFISLGISLLGSVCIILGRDTSVSNTLNIIGLITGLASAFFLCFYTIYGKVCAARVNAWTVLLYAIGFGALAYSFVSPPWVLWKGITLTEFGYVSYLSIFATIIPFGLYFSGLRYLTPSSASIIAMLEPVVASISAYFLLNEKMTFVQILGGLLIILSVIIINIYYVRRETSNNEQKFANNKEELIDV
jgi:drug/metabolite transporter (DMT)-like permease